MKKDSHIFLIALIIFLVGGIAAAVIIINNKSTVEEHIAQATISFDGNNIDEAIQYAEDAVRKDDTNIEALLVLATSYAQKGSIAYQEESYGMRAVELANRVIQLDPSIAEAYRVKGYAYEIMQRYDDAFLAYDASIELDGKNALAYSSRGHAYDLAGNLEAAKRDYEAALEIDAKLDHANLNLARIYVREGDNKAATALLEAVVTSGVNIRFKASAEQILGVIALNSDNASLAKAHFENALRLDPNLSSAYVGHGYATLAVLFDEVEEGEDSAEKLEEVVTSVFDDVNKALAINKNQTSAYLLASQVLEMMGSSEDAQAMIIEAEKSVDLDITLGKAEKDALREDIRKAKAE